MEFASDELWRRDLSKAFIGGVWAAANQGREFFVHNPANGEVITSVPDMGEAETKKAIDVASKAFESWKKTTAKERSKILKKWHALIERHSESLARLLSLEQGKPLSEATGEVAYGASFVEWFAEEAKRAYGSVIPAVASGTVLSVRKEPVGVCALITPWNFPVAMITRKAAPALAAGCAIVIKPSEATPLCALALADLAEEAGVPAGVFNVVTASKGDRVGAALTEGSQVRKLSFTGSTVVGKLLLEQCGKTVKRVSMELGGNAPFIVCADANIEKAVEGALLSKFRNMGQTCVCANRFYVHSAVYDEFSSKLVERVKGFCIGPALTGEVDQGPLINDSAVSKVEAHITDAMDRGAEVLIGGKRHALGGTFFEPTVITNLAPDALLTREETFGPVAGLVRFEEAEEVITFANTSSAGLAAYLYSESPSMIERLSSSLEYGMIGINTGVLSNEVSPFGGVKESGLGREGGSQGLDEYLEYKYLCQGGLGV